MNLKDLGIDKEIVGRIHAWLSAEYDEETRNEIQGLIDNGARDELIDRFYTELEFGTGGMRGKIGAGTNRMNRYVIGMATQGLAEYIIEEIAIPSERKLVIAYDSRHFSREFAEETAAVIAGNGITACIFEDLRPTPELSFAVRHLGATAGVVVTASHNPKEYNGYKVYWSDGAQIVPPHDKKIIEKVRNIKSVRSVKKADYATALKNGMIRSIGKEVDDAYLKAISILSLTPEENHKHGKNLKILYTPLHGAGITLTPAALTQWGFTGLTLCEEQSTPDGDFPSVESPNPEEPAALIPATRQARKIGADVILASDPDCDRLGVVCRQPDGEYVALRGNQFSSLMCYFILSKLKEKQRMPPKPAVVTTIVTTKMIEAIADSFDTHTEYTLTGFKWICEIAQRWEKMPENSPDKYTFLYGTEESLGHVVGTSVRDKDGVIAACIAAEIALWAKTLRNTSLLGILDELQTQYGIFADTTKSVYLTGAEGQEKIADIMENLRSKTPPGICNVPVLAVTDLKLKRRKDLSSGTVSPSPDLPESNVLVMELEGGNQVIARPSGTEPKIKFYFLMQDTNNLPITSKEELQVRKHNLEKKMALIIDDFMGKIESMISR